MKKAILRSLVLVLLLFLAGCSGSKSSGGQEEPDIGPKVERIESPEGVSAALVQWTNALADVYAEIKDRDSARQAAPKLHVLDRKAKILAAKSKEFNSNDLPPEQQQRLEQKFKGDFEKARQRVDTELRRINADSELSKVLKEIEREIYSK